MHVTKAQRQTATQTTYGQLLKGQRFYLTSGTLYERGEGITSGRVINGHVPHFWDQWTDDTTVYRLNPIRTSILSVSEATR